MAGRILQVKLPNRYTNKECICMISRNHSCSPFLHYKAWKMLSVCKRDDTSLEEDIEN